MIPFCPSFYKDELAYSLFARYYARCGYVNYTSVADELFGNKLVHPDPELLPILTPNAIDLLTRELSFEQVVMEHTVFKFYARFISSESRKTAMNYLLGGKKGVSHLLHMTVDKNPENPTQLRYCPICARLEREKYGEAYWHVSHQLIGVNICADHGCALLDSTIPLRGYRSPNLFPAELVIPYDEFPTLQIVSPLEEKLARYSLEVFRQPLYMDTDALVSDFLRAKLQGTPYISQRTGIVFTTKLYAAFTEYYAEFDELPSISAIRNLFSPKIYVSPIYICMMGLFLEVTSGDFKNMEMLPTYNPASFDKCIKDMHYIEGKTYKQIASELNMSLDTAKAIGAERYLTYDRFYLPTNQADLRNSPKKDWATMDAEKLPQMMSAMEKMYGAKGVRPKWITVSSLAKSIGIRRETISKLSGCYALALKNAQTRMEFWLMMLDWGVNELTDNEININTTNIGTLTGIKPYCYKRIYDHIISHKLSNAVDPRILDLLRKEIMRETLFLS